MTRAERFPLLLHEAAFALLLGVLGCGLAWVGGSAGGDAGVCLGLLAGGLALAVWCGREGTPARWRWRLAYYPVAMNVAYFALKTAVPALHPRSYDSALQAIDQVLLGGNPGVALEGLRHPLLTEFLSFCYVIFFPYLVFSWVYYLVRRDLRVAKKFWSGFFMLYGVGFLGYLLVPAAGPHLDPVLASHFTGLHGPITDFNASIVARGSNRVDCFPSLHTAVSAYLLGFDARHCRWRFWLWLVPCVGLWVSTLYLGYHYCADLLAGFALAAVTLALTEWLFSEKSHEPTSGLL